MTWTIHRVRVAADQAGSRLDQYLATAVPELSRTRLRRIIDLGGVHINDRRTRTCSYRLAAADLVEIYLDNLPLEPYRIAAVDLVYQDKYLIVLNKPAMIETQPTHARYKGTLYEALQEYLKDPFRPQQKPPIGMIQRLDRSTSGLIVFSTHPAAHKKMTEMFHLQRIDKHYLAIVGGAPASAAGEIRSQLARSRKENRVHSVTAGGKLAVTRYAVQKRLNHSTLMKVQILTGRSHQIRAHMAEQGCPLLGDQRYGGLTEVDGMPVTRPLLHAWKLAFQHPVTDRLLRFSVPLPHDMVAALRHLQENHL